MLTRFGPGSSGCVSGCSNCSWLVPAGWEKSVVTATHGTVVTTYLLGQRPCSGGVESRHRCFLTCKHWGIIIPHRVKMKPRLVPILNGPSIEDTCLSLLSNCHDCGENLVLLTSGYLHVVWMECWLNMSRTC